MNNKVIIFGLILIFIINIHSQILNNLPLVFQMKGATTYTPDRGGASQKGYKLTIGFQYKSWIGIKFPGSNKKDVLILQINDFYSPNSNPSQSGHQVVITDYYQDSTGLHLDQILTYDISSFGYSNTKTYSLDIIRYQGSNSGQDWDAVKGKYSVTQVCFYTSDVSFNIKTWDKSFTQCYSYQIQNFISTFKGVYLKSLNINGYPIGAYGWIDGPYLTQNFYLYQSSPLYTYLQAPAIVLEIGTTNGGFGQDYHVISPVSSENGDYYGNSINDKQKDTTALGGFNNQALSAKFWNAVPANYIAAIQSTNLLITFKRNINTYDPYDRDLLSTFSFCLYLYTAGSITSPLTEKSCQVVELSYHYPRPTNDVVKSTAFQKNIILAISYLIIVLLVLN